MRLRKIEMTGGVMRGQSGTAIRAARGMLPAFFACLCMTIGGVANAQKVTTVNGWQRLEYTDEISDEKSFWVKRKISTGFSGELALKCDQVGSDIYGMVLFGLGAAPVGDYDSVTLRFDGGQPVRPDSRRHALGRTNFTTTPELLEMFVDSSTLVARVTAGSSFGTETQTGTVSLSGSTSAIDWLEQKCGLRGQREAAAQAAAAATQAAAQAAAAAAQAAAEAAAVEAQAAAQAAAEAAVAEAQAAAEASERVRALERNMIRVPGGTFLMGSPRAERGRFPNEGPQRSVTIQPFEVSKYEVTWALYAVCVSAGSCPAANDDGFGKGDRPVTNVSWDDANNFVSWLSRETGKTYRLLSEAEWEYAARAATTTAYSFGDSISNSLANFSGGLGKTEPVGSYPPNAFGLHDMHGNVWEWVQDCFADSYSANQSTDGRPFNSGSCSHRVIRGGSWINIPQYLRSAYRVRVEPTYRYSDLGFRVARTL